MGRFRVTVDTGGTFSDFVYFNEDNGEITITKIPSTPHDPSEAIIQGVNSLLSQGVKAADIEYFCHGTTVATNALLEGKGARTGLLVTKGFRGVYEVMEQARPYGSAIFDVMYEKPPLLVPPSRTAEVLERVDYQGNVITPLDEESLRAALKSLKPAGLESMAVCLLFSFLYPAHEQTVKRVIAEELPGCSVSLSSEVLPQIREYYRLSTTVINAYLQPILERYVKRLEERFSAAGITTKKAYIMQSNGGTSTFEATAKRAAATVLSGPAGGVTACVHLSQMTGYKNLITFDMGGTSCDVALIKDGKPSLHHRGKIEGRDIALPMMDINTISSGGGTIVRADSMGVLEVGPDSAGAVPGPACYDKGGTMPTITDANLLLGYLSEKNFLGGRMELDKNKAMEAVNGEICKKLNMQPLEVAEGIIRIVNVKMEEAIKAISTMRGYDLREFMLVAFGGAGPIHAAQMARDLGMAGVIVPMYPGVFSAIGLLMSNVKHDYIVSKLTGLKDLKTDDVNSVFSELAERAKKELASEGFADDNVRLEYAMDMRYAGQGYEITVPAAGGILSQSDLEGMRLDFDTIHYNLFGHRAPEEPVEVVSFRLTGIGLVPEVDMPKYAPSGKTLDDAYREHRPVRFNGELYNTPVYQREKLDAAIRIEGPAVIDQYDSTTVVLPGQAAFVDEWKNLIVKEV